MSFSGDLYPTAGADVVMTSSGDMVKYQSGARARLGIGSANQILQVKSSLPSWETVDLADTVLTTAGDVLFENATPELARLPKGSDADVLTLASGLPSWIAPASSGLTINTQTDHLTSSFSTTSNSYVSTGLSLTLSNEADGNANIVASGQWRNLTGGYDAHGTLTDDGTRITDSSRIAQMQASIAPEGFCSTTNMATDGSVIEFEIHNGVGGTAVLTASATYVSALIILELY